METTLTQTRRRATTGPRFSIKPFRADLAGEEIHVLVFGQDEMRSIRQHIADTLQIEHFLELPLTTMLAPILITPDNLTEKTKDGDDIVIHHWYERSAYGTFIRRGQAHLIQIKREAFVAGFNCIGPSLAAGQLSGSDQQKTIGDFSRTLGKDKKTRDNLIFIGGIDEKTCSSLSQRCQKSGVAKANIRTITGLNKGEIAAICWQYLLG